MASRGSLIRVGSSMLTESSERAIAAVLNPSSWSEGRGASSHVQGTRNTLPIDTRTAQRVAGVAGEQHGIDAHSCRRAENGSDVGGIYHTVDDHDAAGSGARFGHGLGLRTAEGAEHASRELIAREAGEQFALAGIDGNVAALVDDVLGVAVNMAAFAKQGHGLVAFIESHLNHFGALGDEDAFEGFEPVAELGFGKRAEELNAGLVEGCNFDDHV